MKEKTYLSISDIIEVVNKRKVAKRRNGKFYLANYPKIDKNRKPTEAQLQVQKKFKRCAEYAKLVITDPVLKNAYQLKARGSQSAYNMAVADASKPPKLVSIVSEGYIGRVGNPIFICATDDFLVKKVLVSVYRYQKLIEEGDAIEMAKNIWKYTATALLPDMKSVRVKATAYDMPGNTDTMEVWVL